MIGYDEEDGLFGEFIFGDRGFTPPGYEAELWKYYWENRDYAISTYERVRLPVVSHLDGDPTNNVICNLALGTQRDNWEDAIRHGTFRPLSEEACEKSRAVCSQPIIAISEVDESRTWFPSQMEAARELMLSQANIWHCLKGQLHQTGGYKFVRAEAEGGDANADCPEQLY